MLSIKNLITYVSIKLNSFIFLIALIPDGVAALLKPISSQIPYALFTSILSFISFTIIPFTNLLVPYLISISMLILSVLFINSRKGSKH